MSSHEVRVRVAEAIYTRRERKSWRRRKAHLSPQAVSSFPVDELLKRCQEIFAGLNELQVQMLESRFPSQSDRIKQAVAEGAAELTSGKRTFLGQPVEMEQVSWSVDPKTGFQWPNDFYGNIRIGGDNPDVKFAWEVSRHQYLCELVGDRALGANKVAARMAHDHLLDWIDKNPLFQGVHWTSALEAGMRAISWTWTMAGLGQLESPSVRKLADGLADHATYLQHHLSYYSSPYNHLMGEATGLYLISFVLHQHPSSQRWRILARKVLTDHVPQQFYQDGFTVEQATGYHFFTLGFLTLAILIARQEKEPLVEIESQVHQSYLAGAALRMPDGRWPTVGDLDSARAIPVQHQDYWNFGSLCSLAAVIFDDPDLAFDDSPGPELYWLQGTEGIERWQQLKQKFNASSKRSGPGDPRYRLLEDSGYLVATKENDWLLFDAGPIAGGLFEDSTPSTAHGHADTFQVLYSIEEREILRDSGIHSYSGSPAWTNYFRSPAAHNTFEISGHPVVRPAGPLAWSHVKPAPQLKALLCDEAWMAKGAVELAPKLMASRYLLCLPGVGLWIADWINSPTKLETTWYWQLAQAFERPVVEDNQLQVVNGSERLISWSRIPIQNGQLLEAEDGSPVGWYATSYGTLQRGRRLSFQVAGVGPTLVATQLSRAKSQVQLASVTVDGHRLDCDTDAMATSDTSHSPAEIEWRLTGPQGDIIFVGGMKEKSRLQTKQLKPLSGVGNWNSCHHRPRSKDANPQVNSPTA